MSNIIPRRAKPHIRKRNGLWGVVLIDGYDVQTEPTKTRMYRAIHYAHNYLNYKCRQQTQC